jgi:adenylate cyclase class 2
MTNNSEVEIRYQLKDETESARVRNTLNANGWVLGKPVKQEDIYFCDANLKHTGKTKDSQYVLRVRQTIGGAKLTYKSFEGSTDGSWIEIESSISDPEAVQLMLSKIGLAEYMRITKIRESSKIGDVEVNLDKIQGLGVFIEMEVMSQDVQVGRDLLRDLAESLGIPRSQTVTQGYVQLMENVI